ncbi:MAG: S41 family peptidase [Planctomycetota bacterium]
MHIAPSFVVPILAFFLCGACTTAQAGKVDKHPLAGKAIALPEPLADGAVDLPRFPSISPDGKTVCFSWRGDLWRVPATGGQAIRLTAHPMNDSNSAWSPDGQQIAFNSDRSGYVNVYTMTADGQAITPVTREDRSHRLMSWADGQTLAVSAYREADVHRNPRPYQVAVTGGPITRLHDAFGASPAVSPDGRYVVFVRGRARWTKPFMTNSDNRDLWLYDREGSTFRRLTQNPGNDGMPRWINNTTLAYLSARPPARVNLYRMDINKGESEATALTAFIDDDVQHVDIAQGGQLAVLHAWDALYTLDISKEKAKPVKLSVTAPTDSQDLTRVMPLKNRTNASALSPDGKVMAMSIQGELFVRTIDSKNPAQRITRHAALDTDPAWSADGQTLYFASDRDGTLSIYQAKVALTRAEIESAVGPPSSEQADDEADQAEAEQPRADHEAEGASEDLGEDEQADENQDSEKEDAPDPAARWHDAIRFEVAPVVQTADHDSDPSASPDGKTLAFRRGNGGLMLLDLATGDTRQYLDQWDSGMHWVWSSDSNYLAVCYQDQDHNADIWVGLADGSTPPVNITKHPAIDQSPSFSMDNKVLTFVSSRNDGQYDVYAVYLDEALEAYTPQQLETYYKQAADRAKKLKPLRVSEEESAGTDDKNAAGVEEKQAPAESETDAPSLDLEDAYLRLRRLTDTPESEFGAVVHPSGGRVVYSRDDAVYSIGWDGKDEKKIADGFDLEHLSLNGSYAVGLKNQTAATAAVGGGEIETVEVTGSIRVDHQAVQKQRFTEASRALTMMFYDGSFKGIDWPAATQKYAQLAAHTWTPDEFDDVANRYLGLLNASHMGIRSPRLEAENSQPNGRLGAAYQRVESGYEVVAVEPNTPAALGPMRLRVGDVITAIDSTPIAAADTIESRLVGRAGRETLVTVLRQAEGAGGSEEVRLLLTPISYRAYDDLRYENWRLAKAARVDELSEGKLGYIHIESMNASSLAEYERDLYAACEGKAGLIIDVRDNGGGWTTDRLLASIMTERHAYTVPRGSDPERTNSYPITRLFIPRYNLPMNALCNENSFSNAEIFSHAFKTLERGTLVGNTTAGGVISTGGTRLLDGTTVRLPFRGWFLPDGTDMENNGAEPDLIIPQTPEDESAGRDRQLEAAVRDLLDRL